MSHLNPRQGRFCQAFVTGASAAAAAREAGYTARSCHSQASRLLKKNRIRRRVADIQAAIGRETGLDRDQLIGKLETVYRRAIADHNYHAATRAVELQGRLSGLLKHGNTQDRQDKEAVDQMDGNTAETETADNLAPFPKLREAVKAGDAGAMARESHFHSGTRQDGSKHRNWGRVHANHCSALGLEPGSDACRATVEKHYQGTNEKPVFDPTKTPPTPDNSKDVMGGAGDDRLTQQQQNQNEAEPPLRPDIQKLKDEMLKPGKPVDDILLKKPEDWTEGEVRDVIKERIKRPMNDPERQSLWNSEKKWFKHFYGDGNAKADEFGKIADPQPIRRMIDKPLDVRTADGRPLSKEISRFSKHLSRAAGDVPAPELVKSLQSGLNTLGLSKRQPKPLPALKEDGVFGPKTRGGLKTAMARLGRPKLEEGAALGRFGTFAASNRPRSFRDLRDTTERSFGPLFRNPGKSVGVESKLEATSLQETLNDLGPKHLGQGFTPLKLDGDIGPRTFDAFSRINKAAGPRSLTERFGSFLGFL